MLNTLYSQTCPKCGKLYNTINEESVLCLDCEFPKRNRIIYNPESTNKRYISPLVKQIVWERDNGKCVCCGSQSELEYDHIIPVSKGGSCSENNIQILCFTCNRTKSDKIL